MAKLRGFKHVSEENQEYGKKGIMPKRGTRLSAGYDFYTPVEFAIKPGETKLVFTNIKAYMQDWEYLQLSIRSSIALKDNLIIPNAPGIVDA